MGFIIGLLIAGIIVTLGIIVYQGVTLVKNLAAKNIFFTAVAEPEVKIILKGAAPDSCISNVKGYTMVYRENASTRQKEDWVLVSNKELEDEGTTGWLKDYKRFEHFSFGGYFLYGILPNVSIASIKIDASSWVENPSDIRSSISHKTIPISSLRAKTERKVVFKNVEIGGGSTLKIDVGFTVILILRNPLIAAFDRKGNFGEIIDAAVKETVTREALKLTDDNLFASGGRTTGQIFDPQLILDELRQPGNKIQNSGYQATALIYHGFDFTPDSQHFVDEKANVREAAFKRQERLEEAEAEKKTLELRGQGRASAITGQVSALTALGVDPNVAAHIFGRVTVAEAVGGKDSDVTMFIEQGAGVQFAPGMIPQTNKTKGGK